MPRSTKLAKQELRALQAECVDGVEANADNPDGSSWAIDFGAELPAVGRQAATATSGNPVLCAVHPSVPYHVPSAATRAEVKATRNLPDGST